MLEKALEQLLLQFLAPYVDGISRDKLHLGVFSGSLELKDLTVKPEALALLGFEDLRIRQGNISLIKLSVPWSKLYTGKVEAVVEKLHLEVESFSDPSRDVTEETLIVEMRESKRKAIDVRVSQLRDLVEEQQRKEAGSEDDSDQKVSYGVKLVRKIVNNIKIALSDVNLSFVQRSKGLACGLEFPKLQALSTDATFREQDEGQVVAVDEAHAMYKLLRLHRLGIRMAPAGSIDLRNAEYMLSPISASLQLAHVPSDQILRVRLEVATEEHAELRVPRSQMKHLLAVQNETSAEQDRLRSLLITPEEERTLCVDASSSKTQYFKLYERWLLHEHDMGNQVAGSTSSEGLTPEEESRMQLIEDALSVRLLARERWVATRKVEALHERVAQKQQESREKAMALERQSRPGFFTRMKKRWAGDESSQASGVEGNEQAVWVTPEEKEQLLADFDDESKVETVDLPQRFSFEFLLGHLGLDLVDDRRASDAQRQLLQLALSEANLRIDVNMATDHRGRDSAEWRTEIRVGAFQALHCESTLLRLHKEISQVDGETSSSPASVAFGDDDGPVAAAKLAVASKLEKEQNLLELDFGFMPVEVHFLPGVVELLLEFWRSPEEGDAAGGSRPAPAPVDADSATRNLRMEEYADMAQEFKEGYGDRAKAVAVEVYERIPDKMQLKVRIASPIVHVPVASLGTAMFSLGELSIQTPQPCAYDSIDLGFKLNHTTLRAVSLRNERFDMIQPVPVDLGIEYRCLDMENSVSVTVKAKGLSLSLAPQALQILLATPTAMMMVLYPEETALDTAGSGMAVETADAQAATLSRQPSTDDAAPAPPVGSIQDVKKVALEVLGSEGNKLLDSYARKIEEVRSKQFRLQLDMNIGALDVTLSDSIVPVMRLRVQMLPPEPDKPALTMEKLKNPGLLTLAVPVGTFEMDILNPRNGAWEPLTERVHLGLKVERKAKGEDDTATHVSICGHEPILLNFTPTAVRTASWILPLFVNSLSGPEEESHKVVPSKSEASMGAPVKSMESQVKAVSSLQSKTGSMKADESVVRYRVVNLCSETVELEFSSQHKEGLHMQVPPTASGWASLDQLVLPNFSTALAARVVGGRLSEPLSLERANAVAMPGSGCVAELLTPSPSHRLLLLATPLRVHNQTDLTLHLRFHDANGGGPLPLDLQEAPACDGALLGNKLPDYEVTSQHAEQFVASAAQNPPPEKGILVLPPHAVAAVPAHSLVRASQASVASSHCWFSVRPAMLEHDFCPAVETGAKAAARTVFCKRSPGVGAGGYAGVDVGVAQGFYLRCVPCTYVRALPVPTALTTIALQPTLALLNALPIGHLTVRFSRNAADARKFEVPVPRLSRWNIYSFQGPSNDGMAVTARLEDKSPFGSMLSFTRDAFHEGSDAGQSLQLRVRGNDGYDGAAAHVLVEPLSEYEVRISCPNLFVDRAGLGGPLSLTLWHIGRPLPSEGGVTLLPMECFEDSCDLVLAETGKEQQRIQSKINVRLPPSWSTFEWSTPNGAFVFCMQAESVSDASLLGAQCQAITVRPRLVLTNQSTRDLELDTGNNQVKLLMAGQSIEHHWQVRPSEADVLSCNLRFRPLRSPPCEWSGTVVCGDVAAGSSPFLLGAAVGVAAKGDTGPEVWSADVAPVRGAVAVSFRQGSDFLAVNCTKTMEVTMSIRPAGCNRAIPDMPVPLGQEVPYGWPRPFEGERPRAVEVVANGHRLEVPDARRTSRSVIRPLSLVVVVARVGQQTTLSLEPWKEAAVLAQGRGRSGSSPTSVSLAAAGVTATGGGGSSMKVELKFSRLGISVIEEVPRPRELLYLHLELIRFEWQKTSDVRQFSFTISEAQVDCQLPGRVDANSLDERRNQSLGLLKEERPAVILANCADGDHAFLTVLFQRGATSSRDLYIPYAEVAFDVLDVTVDDEWLEPFVQWVNQLSDDASNRGLSFETLAKYAGQPITEGYAPPELPYVVQVDQLNISNITFTMWCALKLRSVRFLPQHIRTAIRVLSFSGNFTLDGATLKLEERKIPPHRGSLADFMLGLGSEYTMNLLNNAANMLGKSSLLNLPRVPLRVGLTGVSFLSDTVSVIGGEASNLLNFLTMDEEYAEQQRRLRAEKKISGIQDGMVEAGKSLAQAVEGLADIVKKPVEGAQSGGVGGFFSGVAKGVLGGVVKPISKVGQAISDVGSGVAAQVTPDTQSMKRRRARPRLRQPRLLCSELGVVRPWSELEAEVQRQLTAEVVEGVEAVVPLQQAGRSRRMLLLFQRKYAVADVQVDASVGTGRGGRQRCSISLPNDQSGGSSASSSAGPGKKQGKSMDFLDALDDTSTKLFSQVMKPVNTVMYGVQDMEKTLSWGGGAESSGRQQQLAAISDSCNGRGFAKFEFTTLKAVHQNGQLLQLEDKKGNYKSLPLEKSGLPQDAIEALAAGLRHAASHPDSVANWDRLHAALEVERRKQAVGAFAAKSTSGGTYGSGAGERVLEVWEVERRDLRTMEWRTPFMPLDKELCWRWVDKTGYRHPHLRKNLTAERCDRAREPPCELDSNLFKPVGDWAKDTNLRTDKDGWQYGMAWNSSTWDRHPGLFDGMRRRRWTRHFC